MYVYILKCSDDSFYTGVTNNLERRLKEHKLGINKGSYTFDKRPLKLVYYEICSNAEQAIQLEKRIKGWTRRKKQALIDRNWDKLKEYSICNNTSSHKNYDRDKNVKSGRVDESG